jgi:uncharacterized repeat protein (TIGR02543 family)
LPDPVRNGYTFGGWHTQPSGNGTLYIADTVYRIAADTTLHAKWTANAYKLTFDAQGGTVNPDSSTVTYNAAVSLLPDPVRNGYTFGGWHTQPSGNGTLYAADTVYRIADNTTLYAKWTATTGVAQLQASVNLYPNPFAGAVHLTGAEGCTLTVVTATGAVIYTQRVNSGSETIALDKLLPGVYFFILERNGKKVVKLAVKNGFAP